MQTRKFITAFFIAISATCAFAQVPETINQEVVLPSPTPVPQKKTLDIGGEIRFRFEALDNRDFDSTTNDRHDFIGSRIRLNVLLSPTDTLEAFIQPQMSGVWGQIDSTTSGSGVVIGGIPTSGGLQDPKLSLHQGYVTWKFLDEATLKIGRQELAYGDHIVIGNLNYSNVARSFDAGLIRLTRSSNRFDFFYSKLAENDVAGSGLSGNDDFAGIYATLSPPSMFTEIDVYGLWLRRAKTGDPVTFNFGTFGTRFKYLSNGWNGRFEGALQYGEHTTKTMLAYMVDYEGGYTFDLKKGLKVTGEYNFASGDDATNGKFTRFHSLFPTAHRWLGLMDFFGRQNIQSGVMHLALKLDDQWEFGTDLHSFWRVQSSDILYGLTAEAAVAGQTSPATSSALHSGEELDMIVTYKPTERIEFQALGGVFRPAGYIKSSIGNSLSYLSYMQATFK